MKNIEERLHGLMGFGVSIDTAALSGLASYSIFNKAHDYVFQAPTTEEQIVRAIIMYGSSALTAIACKGSLILAGLGLYNAFRRYEKINV